MAQTDGAHAEARDVGRALAALLADEPALAALLPDGYVERAAAYAGLLLEANRRLNLTRVTDAGRGRPPAPARCAGRPAAAGRSCARRRRSTSARAGACRASRWRWPDPRSAGCWSIRCARRRRCWRRWSPELGLAERHGRGGTRRGCSAVPPTHRERLRPGRGARLRAAAGAGRAGAAAARGRRRRCWPGRDRWPPATRSWSAGRRPSASSAAARRICEPAGPAALGGHTFVVVPQGAAHADAATRGARESPAAGRSGRPGNIGSPCGSRSCRTSMPISPPSRRCATTCRRWTRSGSWATSWATGRSRTR